MLAALLLGLLSYEDEAGLVELRHFVPEVAVDLRYASTRNFTRTQLYTVDRCLVHKKLLHRLTAVQRALETHGLRLMVLDAYRPHSVTRRLWDEVRDPRYVAHPKSGSRHNRGAALDVTLADADGNPVPMPSAYDEFTPRAHQTYRGGTEEQRQNRDLLHRVMKGNGFNGVKTEWWHFDAKDWRHYPVLDVPLTTNN